MKKIVKNRKSNIEKDYYKIPKFVNNSKLFWIGSVLLVVVFAYLVGRVSGVKEKTLVDDTPQYIQTATPTTEPTLIPTISSKPIKIVTPTTKLSTEELINCHIPDQCGGGVRELKVSECSQLICCRISGSTYSAISKTECDRIHAGTQVDQNKAPAKMTSVILPHNGKMVSCPDGSEAKAYNMSSEIKTTLELTSSNPDQILSGFEKYLNILGCKY